MDGFVQRPNILQRRRAGFASTNITNELVDALNGFGVGNVGSPQAFGRFFLCRPISSAHPDNPRGVYFATIYEPNYGNFSLAAIDDGALLGSPIVTDAVFVNLLPNDTDACVNGPTVDARLIGYTTDTPSRMILIGLALPVEDCGEESTGGESRSSSDNGYGGGY